MGDDLRDGEPISYHLNRPIEKCRQFEAVVVVQVRLYRFPFV